MGSSPTSTSAIRCPIAQYEESSTKTSTGAKLPTKAIKVQWELSRTVQLADGEWSVTWDGINVVGTDGADEGYGSLTSGNISDLDDNCFTGRELSQEDDASQLENLDDVYYERIFNDRPLVQSPTKVVPPALTGSPISPTFANRFSVYFLLNSQTPVPRQLVIRFTPTWASPVTPSPCITIPVIKVDNATNDREIHRLWAKSRLADLRELQELADELAQTGRRALNTGIMKVGVDGSAHDVESVKFEADMVGRERNWVLKTFLGSLEQDARTTNGQVNGVDGDEELTEEKEIERGLDMLEKLAKSLKLFSDEIETPVSELPLANLPNPRPISSTNLSKGGEDTEDDLFALPLSPRSPDMAISPFSMFREPSLGNLDGILRSDLGSKNPSFSRHLTIPPVSIDAIPVDSGTPSTPTLMGSPNPGDMRKRRAVGGNSGL